MVSIVAAALGQEAAPAATAPAASNPADEPQSQTQFLRIVEAKDKFVALEIGARTFGPAEGKPGPSVTLVGTVHIGDRSYYRAVQSLLEEYEVVLYESVKPAGTGGAGGETDEQRVASTRAAMHFVGSLIEAHRGAKAEYPADLAGLEQFAAQEDPRLVGFLRTALVDAWGRRLEYTRLDAETGAAATAPAPDEAPPAAPEYDLVSLGADGQPGGDGANADLRADHDATDPLALMKDDGLQSQLADVLNLEFQLDALSYDGPNWRCSDMAMDELNRRMTARGLDFELLGGTLAGSSLPAKLIKALLGMIRVADTFFEGAIADTFKVAMIEMLGDERLIEQQLDQFGGGFGEVIINDRNQIVIDDLKALIEREPQIKSVAVLYGAGHMPDMVRRLSDQLGYRPAPPEVAPPPPPQAPAVAPAERWLTAIKVDFSKSAVSAAEINRIRFTMRQMMRQQMR
jgi:hypothetical protein